MSLRRQPSRTNSTAQEAVPLKFEDLDNTQQAAASLGVHPEALKPIGFLNQSHFETLTKANAIAPKLAQQLAAFRELAEKDPSY